jgi:hypothetical protein
MGHVGLSPEEEHWRKEVMSTMETYEVAIGFVVEAKDEQDAIQQALQQQYSHWTVRGTTLLDPTQAEMVIHTMYPKQKAH